MIIPQSKDATEAPPGTERVQGGRLRKIIDTLFRTDLGPLCVILIFFLGFFWWIPIRGSVPLIGDPMAYSYPLRVVAWDMIRTGSLPLWTPYIFSGYPLLSMAQLGLGYPITWVYLFLPGHWAETVYVLAPFLLAPAFLYAYMRTLGRSRTAALLAGLSFAYGGMMASKLSNGMLPNAVMWTPLVLIAVEKARVGRFLPCLAAAAVAYSMSVLTGIGQGFVLTGLVAVAYAAFIGVIEFKTSPSRAWRPLGVVVGGITVAALLAAFQILETWTALRLSVRNELTYENFTILSFPVWRAWAAFWNPVYYTIESTPYIAPLTLGLAAIGVFKTIRNPGAFHQAYFWMVLAVISGILILGAYTPVYRLLYQIPILNKFRGPSRHSFELTLALSVLAAYGWDSLAAIRSRLPDLKRPPLFKAAALIGALLNVIVAFLWWRDIKGRVPIGSEIALSIAGRSYLSFKIAFVLLICSVLWCVWRLRPSRWRSALIVCCLAFSCFLEASLFMSFSWAYPAIPVEWFETVRQPTRFLKSHMSAFERIYLRVVGFDARDLEPGNLDFLNLAARHRLQNIAGYEPLILQRYSRALGNVWLDGVRAEKGEGVDFSLFDPKSHVLDLLNASHVAGYSNLEVSLPHAIRKDLIAFSSRDFAVRSSWTLSALSAAGDTLALVTSLANSAAVIDGTRVAKLVIRTLDGRTIERFLLAGQDTAEWAYERPDVRARVRHRRPPVFDQYPGDARESFPANRYWCRIPLGERISLDSIEVTPLIASINLVLAKATLVDSEARRAAPLVELAPGKSPDAFRWLRDTNRWEKVYDRDEVLIHRNKRALPRVWMVSAAEVVSEDEALHRIQGDGQRDFDPRRTVLLEAPAPEIAALASESDSLSATARIAVYTPNRVTIETSSKQKGVLVASEINYPGWEARVDGQQVPIYTANYLLRAVVLPPGDHSVEMHYRAPGARYGAVVSVCALILVGGMLIWSRKRRERRGES